MTLSAYCWQLALEFRKREPHVFSPRNLGHGGFIKWRTSKSFNIWMWFFPSASERRVLLIVGVWYTSSHLHIFSPSHLHISSSHLRIFTSYPHISSSNLRIFTSTHIIFTSSHLHIFTYHLHIFTSSHLHILSSHLLSLSLSLSLSFPLYLSLSLSLALCHSLSPSFFFSLFRPRAVPTRRHEMATLSHEMRFDRQKL